MAVLLPYAFQAPSILYNPAAQVGFSSIDHNSRCGTAIPMTNTLNNNIHKNISVRRAIKHTALAHITSGFQHLWNTVIRLRERLKNKGRCSLHCHNYHSEQEKAIFAFWAWKSIVSE